MTKNRDFPTIGSAPTLIGKGPASSFPIDYVNGAIAMYIEAALEAGWADNPDCTMEMDLPPVHGELPPRHYSIKFADIKKYVKVKV
jgi:hypothetical protein